MALLTNTPTICRTNIKLNLKRLSAPRAKPAVVSGRERRAREKDKKISPRQLCAVRGCMKDLFRQNQFDEYSWNFSLGLSGLVRNKLQLNLSEAALYSLTRLLRWDTTARRSVLAVSVS